MLFIKVAEERAQGPTRSQCLTYLNEGEVIKQKI